MRHQDPHRFIQSHSHSKSRIALKIADPSSPSGIILTALAKKSRKVDDEPNPSESTFGWAILASSIPIAQVLVSIDRGMMQDTLQADKFLEL